MAEKNSLESAKERQKNALRSHEFALDNLKSTSAQHQNHLKELYATQETAFRDQRALNREILLSNFLEIRQQLLTNSKSSSLKDSLGEYQSYRSQIFQSLDKNKPGSQIVRRVLRHFDGDLDKAKSRDDALVISSVNAHRFSLGLTASDQILETAEQYLLNSRVRSVQSQDGKFEQRNSVEHVPDFLAILHAQIGLHRTELECTEILNDQNTFASWTSEQTEKAAALFARYESLINSREITPHDRYINTIHTFCKKNGIDAYSAAIDMTHSPTLTFKRDASSMQSVENALEWLELGLEEFEYYRLHPDEYTSQTSTLAEKKSTEGSSQQPTLSKGADSSQDFKSPSSQDAKTKGFDPPQSKQLEQSQSKALPQKPATSSVPKPSLESPNTPTQRPSVGNPRSLQSPVNAPPTFINPNPTPLPRKAPDTNVELRNTSNTLSARSIAYIRLKGSPCFFYLTPNFYGTWSLGNFADAVKSKDGTHWTITPRRGYENAIELSEDGRTYRSLQAERPKIVAPEPPSSSVGGLPEKTISARTNEAAVVPRQNEQSREVQAESVIRRLSDTTVEFPVADNASFSYASTKQRSIKPITLPKNLLSMESELYSIKKNKQGTWELRLKRTESSVTFTIQVGSEKKEITLGNAPSQAANRDNVTVNDRQAPPLFRTETNTKSAQSVMSKKNVQPVITPVGDVRSSVPIKSFSVPQPAREEVAVPADADIPRPIVVEGARSIRMDERVPDVPVRSEGRDIQNVNADRKDIAETLTRLRSAYDTLKNDRADYGGDVRYQLFQSRAQSYLTDLSLPFGRSPFDVDVGSWNRVPKDKIQGLKSLTQDFSSLMDRYSKARGSIEKKSSPLKPIDLSKKAENVTLTKDQEAKGAGPLRVLSEAAGKSASDPRLKSAVEACSSLYQQRLSLTQSKPTPLFGGFFGGVSVDDTKLLSPNQTPEDLTKALLEKAQRTEYKLTLTADQFLNLLRCKLACDDIRSNAKLSDKDRSDQYIDLLGTYAGLLEALSRQSSGSLDPVRKMTGYTIQVGMDDAFSPDTIDWLLSAYLSPDPMKGIPEGSHFYVGGK